MAVRISDIVKVAKKANPAIGAICFCGLAIGVVGAVLSDLFKDVSKADEASEVAHPDIRPDAPTTAAN